MIIFQMRSYAIKRLAKGINKVLSQTPIGKVDEILGPINQVYFTIKPQEGIVATSFKPGDKVYIGGDKLLPLEKYVVPSCSVLLLPIH